MAEKPKRGGHREGAGRKPLAPGDARIALTVRLHPTIVDRIAVLAKEHGVSQSQIISTAIEWMPD